MSKNKSMMNGRISAFYVLIDKKGIPFFQLTVDVATGFVRLTYSEPEKISKIFSLMGSVRDACELIGRPVGIIDNGLVVTALINLETGRMEEIRCDPYD